MSPTAECVLSLSGFQNGGDMTAADIADAMGLSEKEAAELLYRVVLRGELRRWPGIAGLPATYSRPAAKEMSA